MQYHVVHNKTIQISRQQDLEHRIRGYFNHFGSNHKSKAINKSSLWKHKTVFSECLLSNGGVWV